MDIHKISHNDVFLKGLDTLSQQVGIGAQPIVIDGRNLDVPGVVAAARCSRRFSLPKREAKHSKVWSTDHRQRRFNASHG